MSFAVISSDTFASEIGVLDQKVYMITNFSRTTPGVNGGISITGEIAAIAGSGIIAIAYMILSLNFLSIYDFVFITALGFLGCQVDSVLGAVLENRGIISKGQVNLFAALITLAVAIFVI